MPLRSFLILRIHVWQAKKSGVDDPRGRYIVNFEGREREGRPVWNLTSKPFVNNRRMENQRQAASVGWTPEIGIHVRGHVFRLCFSSHSGLMALGICSQERGENATRRRWDGNGEPSGWDRYSFIREDSYRRWFCIGTGFTSKIVDPVPSSFFTERLSFAGRPVSRTPFLPGAREIVKPRSSRLRFAPVPFAVEQAAKSRTGFPGILLLGAGTAGNSIVRKGKAVFSLFDTRTTENRSQSATNLWFWVGYLTQDIF